MKVFVLYYLDQGGTFMGILGAYDTPEKVDAALEKAKADYDDCTFGICAAEVE